MGSSHRSGPWKRGARAETAGAPIPADRHASLRPPARRAAEGGPPLVIRVWLACASTAIDAPHAITPARRNARRASRESVSPRDRGGPWELASPYCAWRSTIGRIEDLFLSHRWADKAIVESQLEELRASAVRMWQDEREVEDFDRIQHAVSAVSAGLSGVRLGGTCCAVHWPFTHGDCPGSGGVATLVRIAAMFHPVRMSGHPVGGQPTRT